MFMMLATTWIETLKVFAKDEDGAVTVDFVVLTAAIMLTGIGVVSSLNSGVAELANDTANVIAGQLD